MTEGRETKIPICTVFFQSTKCPPKDGLLCAHYITLWSGQGRNYHLQGKDIGLNDLLKVMQFGSIPSQF